MELGGVSVVQPQTHLPNPQHFYGPSHVIQQRFLSLAMAAWLFFLMASIAGVHAQFGIANRAQSSNFIEAPRQLLQTLKRAQDAIDEGQVGEAVTELGDLLAREVVVTDDTDFDGQDFFLNLEEVTLGVPANQSVLGKARKMIGDLPPKALEIYELKYGPNARRLLTTACQNQDWELIRSVRRRYFHTYAGYEATWLLAQQELYQGHPLAASLLLDGLIPFSRATEHLGDQTLLFYAVVCRASQRSLPELDQIKGRTFRWPFAKPKSPSSVATTTATIQVDSIKTLVQWIDQHLGESKNLPRRSNGDHTMFGGTPDRNGDHFGQMPLSSEHWAQKTTGASPLQERLVKSLTDQLVASGRVSPPSWTPIKVGNLVMMRTTKLLWGIDYHTGKFIWKYPIDESTSSNEEANLREDRFLPGDQRSERLRQRIWNDIPYGQVTSDGVRAFVLDDLAEVRPTSIHAGMGILGTRPTNTGTNTLSAVELETEGKLLWKIGQGGDPQSSLADAFFLGPPLPVDGKLYVIAETAGDINLVCLDPTNGNEQWRQHLSAIESGAINMDTIRRVVGAVPTYHEGVLICPTGAGTLVAIDLVDRTLRWGAKFRRATDLIRSSQRRGGMQATELMERWNHGVVFASGSTVLATPPESSRLFGLDLLSGRSRFAEKNRLDMKYLAGIQGDTFLVVSSDRVRAYSLANGKAVWTSPPDMLGVGQQVSGLGVFGQGDFLLPTSNNELIRLSLADGSVLGRRTTQYPLGNLVAAGGNLITQSSQSLAVAFGEASLAPLVEQKLQEDPNDPDALVQKAELLIEKKKREEALVILEKVRNLAPRHDKAKKLSITAMIGVLRDDPLRGQKYIARLEQLIHLPPARIELLALLASTAIEEQNFTQAITHLLKLSILLTREKTQNSIGQSVVNDPGRSCSLDGWVAARMHEVRRQADSETVNEINQLIRETAEAKTSLPTLQLRSLANHYADWEGIEPIESELIRRYESKNNFLAIERLLISSRLSPVYSADEFSIDQRLQLAGHYANQQMDDDALAILETLPEVTPTSSPLNPAQTKRAQQIRDDLKSLTQPHAWPEYVSLNWETMPGGRPTRFISSQISKTTVLSGESFNHWRLANANSPGLSVNDPMGSRRVIPLDSVVLGGSSYREATINGSILVITLTNRMMCVDLNHLLANDGEAVLWTRNLASDGNLMTKNGSMTNRFGDSEIRHNLSSDKVGRENPEFKMGPVLGDRVVFLMGGDLIAIDLMTNKIIWRNSKAPKSGDVVSQGDQVAVVSPETNQTVIFDLHDGRQIESKPWKYGRIWEATGSHVVAYVDIDGNRKTYDLRLVNPFSDQVKLEQRSLTVSNSQRKLNVPAASGVVVDGRYLTWMQTDGKALVWDIAQATEIARLELPPFENLESIKAIALNGKMILLPKRKAGSRKSLNGYSIVSNSQTWHRSTDAVYAIDMESGELSWSRDFDSRWGCTLDQAAATPLLFFTRRYEKSGIGQPTRLQARSGLQTRKNYIDLLALDVRDGKEKISEIGHETKPTMSGLRTRLNIHPAGNRIVVHLGGDQQILTFTFDQEKPAPPAQQGDQEALPSP